jgi:F-type H+-transporting ATPase subunit delta
MEPMVHAIGDDAMSVGQQLFAVVDALDSSAGLRRILADPSLPAEEKQAVASRLLSASAADAKVIYTVNTVVASRWSADSDLPDALEALATDAILINAESRGALGQVEDETFAIIRGLRGQRQARETLSDPRSNPAMRAAIVDKLLDGQVDAATLTLARRATTALRGKRFIANLLALGETIAARRSTTIAQVISAVALNDAQKSRLQDLLSRAYNTAVQVYVTIDPSIVGGLRIQVGADVVDTTVLTRLADARRQVAA